MGVLGNLTAKGLVDRMWCGTAKHYVAAASNVAMARSVVNDVVREPLGGQCATSHRLPGEVPGTRSIR